MLLNEFYNMYFGYVQLLRCKNENFLFKYKHIITILKGGKKLLLPIKTIWS